ncbi:hypothetical protein [Emticicia fontis]
MTKVLLGFQFITSSVIHLFCCGLPVLLSISGGLSVFSTLHPFMPVILGLQLIVFGFTFYRLYKPARIISKAIKNQRIIFWFISLASILLFFYPPMHWFKSEETRLKEAQMKRFFKHKTK